MAREIGPCATMVYSVEGDDWRLFVRNDERGQTFSRSTSEFNVHHFSCRNDGDFTLRSV